LKKIIFAFLSFIVILLTNLFAAKIFNLPFFELSFVTGLMFTLIIGFCSSEGGFTSEILDVNIKPFLQKECRTNSHFFKFYNSIPFVVALVYTVISAILSIIVYWKYFF
jgi:hypothetical protein